MKRIKSIEMATNDLLLGVTLGDLMTIVDSKDGYFEIYEGNECVYDTAASHSMAKHWANVYATDDCYINGYGTNSGRKFWQLPESIQDEALKLAGFVESDDD